MTHSSSMPLSLSRDGRELQSSFDDAIINNEASTVTNNLPIFQGIEDWFGNMVQHHPSTRNQRGVNHLNRQLYDSDYLNANCDKTIAEFDMIHAIDNTPATYVTNYILALLCFFMTWKIQQRRRRQQLPPSSQQQQQQQVPTDTSLDPEQQDEQAFIQDLNVDPEGTQLTIVIYFATLGITLGLAGILHQFTYERDDPRNIIGLPFVSMFSLIGTACQFRLILLCWTPMPVRSCIWYLWSFLSMGIILYGSWTGYTNYSISGLCLMLGTTGMTLLFFVLWWSNRGGSTTATMGCGWKLLAYLVNLMGGLVQMTLSPLCGSPAYEVCFEKCPLPAPAFNHNALFHVFLFVFVCMWGYCESWGNTPFYNHIYRFRKS